jgi:RNA polymerase sigma factor (sigma-70 family)
MRGHSVELAEYSKFYIENAPRLIAFLVCAGLSISDAADCVQETLIDALPPVWATLEYPYAWCRRVAHRKACDLVQRRKEAPFANPELSGTPLLAPNFRAENFEANHEFLHWLARVKSDRQRQILAWTHDGATPTEIAAELDMHPATVRSTLRNVRAALRRLRAEGGEQE